MLQAGEEHLSLDNSKQPGGWKGEVDWCCQEAACSFLGHPDTQDNHTETMLLKPLLGPLALATYLLTLTS